MDDARFDAYRLNWNDGASIDARSRISDGRYRLPTAPAGMVPLLFTIVMHRPS